MKTDAWIAAGALMLLWVALGCGKSETTPVDENGKPIAQKICPVMGDPINPKIYVDYNGRRVYFCCNACPSLFKKDPEKYLKIVDEQLQKAGAAGTAAPETATVYTCPMHPEVKESKEGKCPKCDMPLVPVKATEAAPK